VWERRCHAFPHHNTSGSDSTCNEQIETSVGRTQGCNTKKGVWELIQKTSHFQVKEVSER